MFEKDYANQGQQLMAGSLGATARMPSIRERAAHAVVQAESHLATVKEALALLDKNPDLERLIDLMQRAHF